MFNKVFFLYHHYEKKWKNTVGQNSPQLTIRRLRIACWIIKAINAHSEYLILISFPLQTMVAIKRFNITLYVICLSCSDVRVIT